MNPEREDGPASPVDTGREPPLGEQDNPADSQAHSLLNDIEDLVLDAKTYLDAELSYQKTRAGFVGECLKRTIAFGIGAGLLVFFAVIGIVVGLIIALTPHITAWGATAAVSGALLLGAWLLVKRAGRRWGEMMDAIHEGKDSE